MKVWTIHVLRANEDQQWQLSTFMPSLQNADKGGRGKSLIDVNFIIYNKHI